jgi:hypothetical protein
VEPTRVERRQRVVATLEKDTYGFLTDFARRPGGAFGCDDGASWFRSGVAYINYNGVVGANGDVDATVSGAPRPEYSSPNL